MARIDPERAAERYREHRSINRVAAMMGATGEGVRQCLIRHGVSVQTREAALKALNADPEFKAKISKLSAARMKALNADPEFKARHRAAIRRHFDGCEVPSWVPADLRDDYIDVARLSGEEVAASHVRRLKREAAL